MNPSELVSAAIDHLQMEGADSTVELFPELASHRPMLEQLEALEDQLDEAESQVRRIEARIESTADQLRLAMGVEK